MGVIHLSELAGQTGQFINRINQFEGFSFIPVLLNFFKIAHTFIFEDFATLSLQIPCSFIF